MATLAVAKIEHIGFPNAVNFVADVSFIGFGTPEIDSGMQVLLGRDRTQAQWHAAVRTAVQNELTNTYGYVFAGGDAVELI